MKYLKISGIALSLLLALQYNYAQQMKLEGKVSGIEGKTVRLAYLDRHQNKVEDTLKVNNNEFSGTVKVGDIPEKGVLYIGRIGTPFWMEAGVVKISGSEGFDGNIEISGLKTQDEAIGYANFNSERLKELNQVLYSKNSIISPGEREDLMEKYQRIKNESEDIFVKDHPNSFFSLELIANSKQRHEKKMQLFSSLDSVLKGSVFGKQVLEDLKVSGRSESGQKILSFTRNDINGKSVSIESFKGKYVLIDFWASWCKPCRAENPNVLAAYNKYKDSEFTVISVSIDDDIEAWKKAIAQDKLPWTQVRDRKDKKSEILDYYGIMTIPSTILINPEGIIVAQNLRGEALEKQLKDILLK